MHSIEKHSKLIKPVTTIAKNYLKIVTWEQYTNKQNVHKQTLETMWS